MIAHFIFERLLGPLIFYIVTRQGFGK